MLVKGPTVVCSGSELSLVITVPTNGSASGNNSHGSAHKRWSLLLFIFHISLSKINHETLVCIAAHRVFMNNWQCNFRLTKIILFKKRLHFLSIPIPSLNISKITLKCDYLSTWMLTKNNCHCKEDALYNVTQVNDKFSNTRQGEYVVGVHEWYQLIFAWCRMLRDKQLPFPY